MTKTYDLVGIGNAVVDVITQCDDAFLGEMAIDKGIMPLIDQDRGETLYDAMSERVQTPGGAVANTIAGAGALGLNTAFIGRVNDDALGHFYADAMRDQGTDFVNAPVPREAARATTAGGGLAGIAISDPFCVERHRADFLSLIKNDLGYVVGNHHEIMSLFETDNLEEALSKTADICANVVCTRSGDGVTLIREGERVDVAVDLVTPVDATGAGDQFAAGYLYGMAKGADLETCGRMGNLCAGEVISHIGPRPQKDMLAVFKAEGLV